MTRRLILLALACLATLGASKAGREYLTGKVLSVDGDAGIISAGIGEKDGALRGMGFSVVDDKGRFVASFTAAEVYKDILWSSKVPADRLGKIRPGMEVRLSVTPEVASLFEARKVDTAAAYRGFLEKFPDSRFMPELIRAMPEEKLRELNPDYHAAWKKYTLEAFREVMAKYPNTAFASAAAGEIKAIENYEAGQERLKAERARRAAEAETERKRREAIEEKVREGQQKKAQGRELLGKLANNSSDAVRFVFKEPSELPPTTVLPGSSMDVRLAAGSYSYEVYKAQETASSDPGEKPQPLKTGTVDIESDFWEASYP